MDQPIGFGVAFERGCHAQGSDKENNTELSQNTHLSCLGIHRNLSTAYGQAN